MRLTYPKKSADYDSINLQQFSYNVMPAWKGGEFMFKTSFLKGLASQLTDALPASMGSLKKDFENQCQLILTKTFNKLDLVTAEEFATQAKVLARTRQKLEQLEHELHALQTKLQKSSE